MRFSLLVTYFSLVYKSSKIPFPSSSLRSRKAGEAILINLPRCKLFHFSIFFLLPFAFCLLPFAFCLLPFAIYLLPFTFYLLPFAFCLLPFAICLLPFTFCLLPFAFYLLPFAFCLLPFAFCLSYLLILYKPMPFALCPVPHFFVFTSISVISNTNAVFGGITFGKPALP